MKRTQARRKSAAAHEPKSIKSISDLCPDPKNANKGTERGLRLLDDSLRENGAGRSILVDRNGMVIAGNKTLERAADIGLKIRPVQTNGHELVVVQRTDLDLGNDDGRARRMAYLDNRVAELDLEWDANQMLADVQAGIDLSSVGFSETDLKELLSTNSGDIVNDLTMQYRVLILCESEAEQTAMLQRFLSEGLKCQALIL